MLTGLCPQVCVAGCARVARVVDGGGKIHSPNESCFQTNGAGECGKGQTPPGKQPQAAGDVNGQATLPARSSLKPSAAER